MPKDKQEKEREFHNKAFAEHTRRSTDAFYSVLLASRLFFEGQLVTHGAGKRVLEYGCGAGTYSFRLAREGATVTGIDISDVAIQQAADRAKRENLEITYERMDAEQLEFPDSTFDLVCGVAILHHLDLDRAYSCLSRVLKPRGRAVFMEPLGHNPAINLYRRLTPHLRTEDEHPLRMQDIRKAEGYFDGVDSRFFTLHALLAVPFRRMGFFKRLVKGLDAADKALFAVIPPARRYAWQVVPVLTLPRRGSSR
jgi:SAM-dependent methyltransferase